MREDVSKYLFIGAEHDKEHFFQRAQEYGIIHFIMPNKAIFNIIAESNMVPAIGAVEYVFGCHVWNGNKGTLTANANKKPENIQHAYFAGIAVYWIVSYAYELLYTPIARMDNNMNKEPNSV